MPDNERKFDGGRLRGLREQRGLNKNQLAVSIPVHASEVKRWEDGTEPRGRYMERLCAIFDVRPSYFFGEEEGDRVTAILENVRNAMGADAAELLPAFSRLGDVSRGRLLGHALALVEQEGKRQETAPPAQPSPKAPETPKTAADFARAGSELVPDPRSKTGGMVERRLLEKLEKKRESSGRSPRPPTTHRPR